MSELKYKYLAEDQYGNQVWIEKHPRAELCAHHGVKHAAKMYHDVNGASEHIGYVVSGHWYSVFAVSFWKK